jgi:endogenous inhibitor of DNA gyrase (YacG/DUF329 family)
MSVSLKARIVRLTKADAKRRACPSCSDPKKRPFKVLFPGEDAPEPVPCPECGKPQRWEICRVTGGGWMRRDWSWRPTTGATPHDRAGAGE